MKIDARCFPIIDATSLDSLNFSENRMTLLIEPVNGCAECSTVN